MTVNVDDSDDDHHDDDDSDGDDDNDDGDNDDANLVDVTLSNREAAAHQGISPPQVTPWSQQVSRPLLLL